MICLFDFVMLCRGVLRVSVLCELQDTENRGFDNDHRVEVMFCLVR